MTTIIHGLIPTSRLSRLNCALPPRVAVDPYPTLGASPDGHFRPDQIASAVKSKERT